MMDGRHTESLEVCDRALLVLYDEDLGEDGPGHPVHGCAACRKLLDDAAAVLATYRAEREPGTFTVPPIDERMLRSLPRQRIGLAALALAAGLLLLAAAGAMEGTRPGPAFALTDRQIFWDLSFMYTDWGAVRAEPLWYRTPFLEDLEGDLDGLDGDLRAIEATWRTEAPRELEPLPAWDDLAPDAVDETKRALHRRIDETRRALEEWI